MLLRLLLPSYWTSNPLASLKRTDQVSNTVTIHVSPSGLWLGLSVCSVLEVVFFLILIFRLDWKKVTHEVITQEPPKYLPRICAKPSASINRNDLQQVQ